MIDFAEILFETLAAMGEAIALPKIKPPIASQRRWSNMVMNVRELIKATKKREALTAPSENLA
jgi:hypothetical protein